jgi:outer membrane lipoprotein-sorting protein
MSGAKKKIIFFLCAGLVACPKPVTMAGPAPEPAALHAQAQAAHRVPETLSCDAKAFVDAKENGGRYSLHLSVKRPGSIRIEALNPMGDPAAVLVADQGRFALLDLRNNVFYRGPATPQNLSRLIPAPLTAEELAALLTGAVPAPAGAQPTASRREGDGYRLTLTAPDAVEHVTLGGDLRVIRVSREEMWEVSLDDHDDSSGAQVPRLLHLEAPGTKVDLKLRNLVAGKLPPPGAFVLDPPPGMRIEDLQ